MVTIYAYYTDNGTLPVTIQLKTSDVLPKAIYPAVTDLLHDRHQQTLLIMMESVGFQSC